MNKKKLIELRCKAWGITEDEYYCNRCSDFSLEDMARAYRRGKNKVRAELKCECRRCVYTDSPCILSDYGKDRNGICDHFKDVFDENAELKEELKAIDEAGEHVRKQITESFRNKKPYLELEKENSKLKEVINNDVDKKIYVQLAKKAELADIQKGHLTKAKELLNEFMRISQASAEDFEHDYSELIGEAEQFLNGEKVIPCSYISCRNCDREDCGIKKLGLVEVEK